MTNYSNSGRWFAIIMIMRNAVPLTAVSPFYSVHRVRTFQMAALGAKSTLGPPLPHPLPHHRPRARIVPPAKPERPAKAQAAPALGRDHAEHRPRRRVPDRHHHLRDQSRRLPDLLDLLTDAYAAFISRQPGFISAGLHVNDAQTRIANYSQWTRREDYQAMLRSEEMRARNREITKLCRSFEPVMYEVAQVFE